MLGFCGDFFLVSLSEDQELKLHKSALDEITYVRMIVQKLSNVNIQLPEDEELFHNCIKKFDQSTQH